MSDKQLKQWQYAYDDYKIGMKQADIAAKYKVSISTVKSWHARHWKSMQVEERKNAWKQDAIVDGMHNPTISQDKIKMIDTDKAFVRQQYKGIVAKQIDDTKPDKIYNSYTKDNLPDLEPREARFVEEFLVDLSKTDAAIRAGYSIDTAAAMGCRLYDKPKIFAHIQVALAERRRRTGVNVDTTIRELARIGFANPAKVVAKDGSILDTASDDDLRAISSIKVKQTHNKDGSLSVEREVRFNDKNKALEMLAKHQGMFIDRQIVLQHSTGDISKLSDAELQKELHHQLQLANTIDVTPTDADKMQTD